MGEQSNEAMWRIALRQTAPAFKNLLEAYASMWSEFFFNLHIAFSYQEGKDIQDPQNTLMVISSILSKRTEIVPYEKFAESGSSEMTLLIEMFPMFYEHIENQAKEWDVTIYQIFLLIRYVPKSDPDKADSLEVQMRTVPSSGKTLMKVV
jgi:hypothetical protein